jgi:hypothetical protein
MKNKYTKYIIQMKITNSEEDVWCDYNDNFITLEQAQESIKFFREVHVNTHLFRIAKRDYETIDTVLEE